MKKLIVLMLMVMLTAVCAAALAEEPAPLTVDELMNGCDELLTLALQQEPVMAALQEDKEQPEYLYDYGAFALYTADVALTEDSRVLAAVIKGDEELPELRGVGVGSTLEELLNAYPLDNPLLRGTYDEAVLYLSGELPGTVNAGYAVRSGSHVLVTVHEIYTADGDSAELCSVIYTLENNMVTAVEISLNNGEASLDEAQDALDRLAELQEKNEYSVYRSEDPAPMAREDLGFGPIDFISATADGLTALLDPAQSDTWEADGSGFLRVLQWEGVQAILQYDGQRKEERLALLQVYGEQLEGPRGLHMGDGVESVIARFPHEQEIGILYGDGENAPYGVCEMRGDGAYIAYAAEVDGETVLLSLTFVNDRLADMTCTWL